MKLSRSYEPEVDGLRALAVLVVVLFHAGIRGFKGGFVGVDIFFVISGYLITRNILSDISLGRFTYRDFYTRRARRIFPAMYVTMVLSAIAGFFIFSPLDLERFAASSVYACGALQNVFFWTEAGYWDA
jgi:peptidoglycan/LPS O-acetylase OafA/YrhL